MTTTLETGKITREVFEGLIYPRLGAPSDAVLVGPRHGVDCAVVSLGGGQVMALTTDPFYVAPHVGLERAGWFAFHILASDLSTSGLAPRYMTVDLNLPVSMTARDLEVLWEAVHREGVRHGVSVVTGHTARYDGCAFPMVGGATMIGVGPEDRYVWPGLARAGDRVLVTKGAAIEAAALLAATFPSHVAERCGEKTARAAEGLFWSMSTLEDARIASSVGVRDRGVSCMHDATECGVRGALFELAEASGLGLRARLGDVPVPDAARAVCNLFGMDPLSAISEGTLVLACREHAAGAVLASLRAKGIAAADVGELTRPELGVRAAEGGRERALEHPRVDPFWAAYGRAMETLRPGQPGPT